MDDLDNGRRKRPVLDDPDTMGFWAAAREHRLVVRRCRACETVLCPPRAYCSTCGSWDTAWVDVSGVGSVYSWTVVEHTVDPAYPSPYTLVLVDLADAPGARLVGHLPDRQQLTIGQPMSVWFENLADDVVLPQWRPA